MQTFLIPTYKTTTSGHSSAKCEWLITHLHYPTIHPSFQPTCVFRLSMTFSNCRVFFRYSIVSSCSTLASLSAASRSPVSRSACNRDDASASLASASCSWERAWARSNSFDASLRKSNWSVKLMILKRVLCIRLCRKMDFHISQIEHRQHQCFHKNVWSNQSMTNTFNNKTQYDWFPGKSQIQVKSQICVWKL